MTSMNARHFPLHSSKHKPPVTKSLRPGPTATEGGFQMAGINWTRVLLGGVLAAVILMAGGWLVDGVLLLERWNAQAASMGKQMDMSGAGMVAVLVWAFGLGIIMTWLYAAIRAQYGPGVGTALKAVLAV